MVVGEGLSVSGQPECDPFTALVAGWENVALPENGIVRHAVLVVRYAVKTGATDLLTCTIYLFR